MAKIVIDPITRIEGHLRIEAEINGGRISDAWSSSAMFRGVENILKGRDPRDAWYFVQRFCGVCTTVHAIASVRSVENALGIKVPENAELIRNLIMGIQNVQDHVIHFYHLHALDWVDITSGLKADPALRANASPDSGAAASAESSDAAGQGVAQVLGQLHVAFDAAGNIYAVNNTSEKLRIYSPGGYTVATKDVLPYSKTVGNRARIYGVNAIGLARRGFSPELIEQLRKAYRHLVQHNTSRALELIERDPTLTAPEVSYLVNFIASAHRGVILRRPSRRLEDLVDVE